MKGTPETPQCGFSRASIQILGMQGVDPEKFTAFNVLEDQDLRAGMSPFFLYMYEAAMRHATVRCAFVHCS
jgi:glutaredoxin-related protein